MNNLTIIIVTSLLCSMLLVERTHALFGLCSTDWFTEGCFDNGDECRNLGGECRHDGYGDHGEGCACIKTIRRNDRLEYETLTKDHFNGKGEVFLSDILRGQRAQKRGR